MLQVHTPDDFSPLQVDLAAVRWALGWKFGLEFIRLRPEMQERLQRHVETLDPGQVTNSIAQ